MFPNNAAVFHDGKLPLRQACEAKATHYVLNKIFKLYPNVITQKTENNNDMALHCYLSSSETSINKEMKKTATFLVKKNVDALIVQNKYGWYPVHIAAYHNLPIDIIYYIANNAPITIIPNPDKQVH